MSMLYPQIYQESYYRINQICQASYNMFRGNYSILSTARCQSHLYNSVLIILVLCAGWV